MSSFFKAFSSIHRFAASASLVTLLLSFFSLVLWAVAPVFSFQMMQVHWVGMSPPAALAYAGLAALLFFYNTQPPSRMRTTLLSAGGLAFCLYLSAQFAGPYPTLGESPFTAAALFALAAFTALIPLAKQRRRRVGDALGGTVLFLLMGFLYFLISYCHGVRSLLEGDIPCPRLLSVVSTVLLAAAILGSLGPAYFPIRRFVGGSVRAALLRKSVPVTIAILLVFVCVKGGMPAFLSPAFSAFLTMMVSSSIVIYLVMRSSSVVASQLETALQESEQNYTQLVRGLKDYAVFLLNAKGDVLVWNPGAEQMTGYPASDVIGEQVTRIFSAQLPGLELAHALEQVQAMGAYQTEGWMGRKSAPPFWAETAFSKLMNPSGKIIGVSVIIRDATERRKAEEAMRASLREKEVLLKEIHHRVKNNLQVISSLLRLQSETVRDKETAALFLDSQERVRAMAMVHEFLYKSADLARINFPAYVASLVRNLYRAFGLTASAPAPTVVVDDVRLSLDVAVPSGLLLTELISNAVKYAYPSQNGGPVEISFRSITEGRFQLSVSDHGVGFPADFDWTKSDSLGLRLVRLLSEQLQGQLVLEKQQGVKFTVTFKDRVV